MLSPLIVLLVELVILITSALNLLPAISNEVRVLVLGSKNKLIIVFPLRVGTFLIERVDILPGLSGAFHNLSCNITTHYLPVIFFQHFNASSHLLC